MTIARLNKRINSILTFELLRYRSKKYVHRGGYLIDKNTVFLVFLPATDYYYLPFFQLYQYENVVVDFSYVNSNKMLTALMRRVSSDAKYRKFSKTKYDKNKKYVIFFDGQYSLGSLDFREYLQRKYPGCKIIFHLGDLIATKKGINIDDIKEFSDLVVTFDHNDANKHNLMYHPDPFSRLPSEMLMASQKKSQIIFYGYAKNRAKEILRVYDVMKANHINCDFSIPDIREEDCISRPELANANYTPYLNYLKIVQNTDCILEIIQKGSLGCTFRTWEAVVYNKRLITNNQSVREEKFYNPQYIQVIDSMDDIDVDWLKENVKVDYEYAELLSPKACFEFYLECLKNSMGK